MLKQKQTYNTFLFYMTISFGFDTINMLPSLARITALTPGAVQLRLNYYYASSNLLNNRFVIRALNHSLYDVFSTRIQIRVPTIIKQQQFNNRWIDGEFRFKNLIQGNLRFGILTSQYRHSLSIRL